MKERRLKTSAIYMIYGLFIIFLIGVIYLIEMIFGDNKYIPNDDNLEYVSKTIFDTIKPVISEKNIVRPYNSHDVKVLKSFYDYKGTNEVQENSIIYYEGIYMQSSGVSYGSEEVFDVQAIKEGTVINVKEDEILGNIVEIKHLDNMISVYQSLSDVMVKEGDIVSVGQIIAKSGISNIEPELKNHLYFEIIIDGNNVNPEDYFNENI